jgi:hypothetical protein
VTKHRRLDMKSIPLTQGKFALVDDEDYDYLIQWKWFATRYDRQDGEKTFYAARAKNTIGILYMHKVILSVRDGFFVDHKNRDGLDNRRKNLRECTTSQNAANKEVSKKNKTGYKGVSLIRKTGKYIAQIRCNGEKIRLGLYSTPEEAARAYDKAAKEYHGEFAWLNFPDL